MRETLESGIPDTAPYKEWLGLVGSMALAVLICAVLSLALSRPEGVPVRRRAIRYAARGPWLPLVCSLTPQAPMIREKTSRGSAGSAGFQMRLFGVT
jgi:CDP-diglyceride synthetase